VRGAMVVSLAIMLAVASCGGDPEPPGSASGEPTTAGTTKAESPSPESPPQESPSGEQRPEPSGTLVRTAPSDYGTMLFDESGQAVYLFDRETSERPRCYGACAGAWPPVLTKGDPQADGRVRSSLLATTERKDGTLQVTYAGHPLYYYAHEGKNEVLCHNVVEFGGTWLVVRPSGEAAP
jgi:predicted lipoprotein with Yx(FWY)xxD motif